jgi:hypothetical protein
MDAQSYVEQDIGDNITKKILEIQLLCSICCIQLCRTLNLKLQMEESL